MTNKKKQGDPKEEELEFINEDTTLDLKIAKLKKELEECQKMKDEYLAGWQRAKADFINARREEDRAREEFLRFAEERILYELLTIMDSFEMAFAKGKELTQWSEGIQRIYIQLAKMLEIHGVSVLESAVGKQFNPEQHEAIERIPVHDQKENNVVLEELQHGYAIQAKILRPSKVKVGIYEKKF